MRARTAGEMLSRSPSLSTEEEEAEGSKGRKEASS